MSLKRAILSVVFAAAASTTLAAEPIPTPTPSSSSSAQDRMRATLAADIGPLPPDVAILDGYVSREDWTSLIKRLALSTTPIDVLRDLDWERLKVVNGGNILFDIAYVNTLRARAEFRKVFEDAALCLASDADRQHNMRLWG